MKGLFFFGIPKVTREIVFIKMIVSGTLYYTHVVANGKSQRKTKMKHYRFNTWDVYPVVDYFQRHFKSIWARFNNVMGPVPKFMLDLKVMEDLKKLRDDLDKDFVINVFGSTDVTRKDIVMNKQVGEKMSDSERTVGLTMNLVVVRRQGTDKTELMRELHKHLVEVSSHRQSEIVVFYESETDLSESTEGDIKLQIKETLQKAYLDCHNICIVKGSVKDELGKKLSEVFERRVAEGFLAVRSDLGRFVQTNAPKSATVDETKLLIETESCVRAIKNFLYRPSLVIDFGAVEKVSYAEGSDQVQKECMSVGVREQTVTLEHGQKSASEAKKSNLVEEDSEQTYVSGSAQDDVCLDIVVRALSKMIRCAAAEPLAVKFTLPLWVCNGMLIQMDFEAKLASCLSKYTKHHLSKLFRIKFHKQIFGFILYQIQSDYKDSKVETDVKTILSSMKRLADVMKKMAFEANWHLQQTVLKEENPITVNEDTRKRVRDMRREILKLDGIFGLGIVFDQLEIHFEHSDEIDVDTLKTRIDDIMKKHHYFNGYCIKEVITPLMKYVKHYFKQGDIVSCPYPGNMREFRKGTLGGFASDNDGKAVYGLTCAHVVNPFQFDRLVVYIQNTEHQPRLEFAHSTPQGVMINRSGLPFVDIAAVELGEHFKDNYDFGFKNEKKQSKSAVLADESPQAGTHVYKFGATTGLTEGIISSPYYQLKDSLQTEHDQFEDSYIILIEYFPGVAADIPNQEIADEENEQNAGYGLEIDQEQSRVEITNFAEPGDSGAIVCSFDPKSDIVTAIAMLCGGDLVLRAVDEANKESACCCSFLLKSGLQGLGKQFKNDPNYFNLDVAARRQRS